MLVVNRFVVATDEAAVTGFQERVRVALAALAARPGYRRGELGRAYDDPARWTLVTEWESVGAYRRALSAMDVKIAATPLLGESTDEPSAYETLLRAEPGGPVTVTESDRAGGDRTGSERAGNAVGALPSGS